MKIHGPPLVVASFVGRTRPPSKAIWFATDGSTPAQSAFRQYRRYAADFSDVTNTKQYIEKAKSFFRKPPEGTLRLTGKGKIFLYDMESETFGIYQRNGVPMEFYKLNIFRHKYSSNLEFFYYAPDQ